MTTTSSKYMYIVLYKLALIFFYSTSVEEIWQDTKHEAAQREVSVWSRVYLWLIKYRSDGVRHIDDTSGVTLNDKQKSIGCLQCTNSSSECTDTRMLVNVHLHQFYHIYYYIITTI